MTHSPITRTINSPTFFYSRTRWPWLQLVLMVILLAFAVALPYLGADQYVVSLAMTILIAAMLAASVNFLVGDGGMASLGHGAIAAASSYGAGWASRQGLEPEMQIVVALGVTLVVSFVYGALSMRTSGIFFLMVTLALGMVIFGLAYRWSGVTGGENGITGIRRPDVLGPYWIYYFFLVGMFVLVTVALWVISRSPFGASLRGIRDSETRMRSLGYNVPAYKLGAFMMSGFVAGLAGLLAVWHTHFVSPSSAGVHRSVLLIVMVILGGVGTTFGPLMGAAVVVLIENVVSNSVERWPTLLGLVFILVILFARKGIMGGVITLLGRFGSGPPSAGPPGSTGGPPADPLASSDAPLAGVSTSKIT
ncbi:branched-chain amino acid ABC transporter permease [Microbacterium album]|uniref:Branched-chain amino acid ABC transporter permease n=1 Tax=Microbacterium album TaxID=2053191 RepID=A0A917MLX5_9MICO|nr:branched-chain amino acid ABC transporter permease [Microbacterium album]GGH43607.1 branched-chain amino acid ABC transporter permease [Microbacterium album]